MGQRSPARSIRRHAELHFNGTSDFIFSGGPVVIGGSDSVGNSTVKLLDPSNATLDYTPPALSR